MSNRGTFGGVTRGQAWREYDPAWLATNIFGNPTMPDIGNGTKLGRYVRLTGGLVVAQVQLVFGSTTTYGNGDAYIIGLPFPANRWTANLSNSGNADLPIGTALAWQGSSASPTYTMPLVPTLADPLAGYNLQTNEDYFAHLFCAHSLSQGTGAVISGTNTSVTVTHNLGVTPVASDIQVVCVAKSGTPANPRAVYVDSITSTQFNINVVTAPGGATSLTFDWKCRAEPNNSGVNLPQLVSYRRPWTWASGHGIYCQFIYEARF